MITTRMSFTKKYAYVLLLLFSCTMNSVAQVSGERCTYDLDSLLYKKSINGHEIYFDRTGKIIDLYDGEKVTLTSKDDSLIRKVLFNSFIFPKSYVDNGFGSSAYINVSFLIEPSGHISNFRILNGFNGKCKREEFLPTQPVFPSVKPVIINGNKVTVEFNMEIIVTCLCTTREHKALGYKIKELK